MIVFKGSTIKHSSTSMLHLRTPRLPEPAAKNLSEHLRRSKRIYLIIRWDFNRGFRALVFEDVKQSFKLAHDLAVQDRAAAEERYRRSDLCVVMRKADRCSTGGKKTMRNCRNLRIRSVLRLRSCEYVLLMLRSCVDVVPV